MLLIFIRSFLSTYLFKRFLRIKQISKIISIFTIFEFPTLSISPYFIGFFPDYFPGFQPCAIWCYIKIYTDFPHRSEASLVDKIKKLKLVAEWGKF